MKATPTPPAVCAIPACTNPGVLRPANNNSVLCDAHVAALPFLCRAIAQILNDLRAQSIQEVTAA